MPFQILMFLPTFLYHRAGRTLSGLSLEEKKIINLRDNLPYFSENMRSANYQERHEEPHPQPG